VPDDSHVDASDAWLARMLELSEAAKLGADLPAGAPSGFNRKPDPTAATRKVRSKVARSSPSKLLAAHQ
jgi:hypothetical protein